MKLKKTLLAASLAAMSLATFAQTDDASKDGVEAAPSTEWAATANVSLVSEYRFRGIRAATWKPTSMVAGSMPLTKTLVSIPAFCFISTRVVKALLPLAHM